MAREMDGIERIRAGPAQGGKPPDQLSPQEMHAVLWQVLSFRDSGELELRPTRIEYNMLTFLPFY